MLKHFFEGLLVWLPHTQLAAFMYTKWAWPMAESLHFIGLSMLIGAVGIFDLRLLGIGRQIALPALHRIIPWGILGYVINFMTGLCFFTAAPDQYLFNPSFQLKVLSMSLAGLNVLLFYTTMFRTVRNLEPGEQAPLPARIMGGVSLASWMGVITFGRLLTFFRPPFHWCPWC
jgi:hypothetical protein